MNDQAASAGRLFTDDEISKAKELERLKVFDVFLKSEPLLGSYVRARLCPKGCLETPQAEVFLVVDQKLSGESLSLLPSFDQLLKVAKVRNISFSQITDYLHRRRFADGKEREGLMQLLIELSR